MASPTRLELSATQQELADLLRNTKVKAPVGRRRPLETGNRYNDGVAIGGFEFYHVDRVTKIIDFPEHHGEFTSKKHELEPNAPLLPYYINARRIPEEALAQMGVLLTRLPFNIEADFCAGIPNAGDELAVAFSKEAGIPSLKVLQKEVTTTGRRITSNGVQPPPDAKRLLLIDNAITTGASVVEAITALGSTDWQIAGLIEVFDREEGGAQRLAREVPDIAYFAALSCQATFKYFLQTGSINLQQYNNVQEYLKELGYG